MMQILGSLGVDTQ